jgi:bifunctional DNA-binding transcriptional regulator/antitoxin component of YhaV-PrlF toxin-antitoxin module
MNDVATATGQVGRRGTIILSAAARRRYGLSDGSLFISEERAEGILIRPAKAVPADLREIRRMIKEGFDELDRGEGIDGEKAYAHMKQKSAQWRARNRK